MPDRRKGQRGLRAIEEGADRQRMGRGQGRWEGRTGGTQRRRTGASCCVSDGQAPAAGSVTTDRRRLPGRLQSAPASRACFAPARHGSRFSPRAARLSAGPLRRRRRRRSPHRPHRARPPRPRPALTRFWAVRVQGPCPRGPDPARSPPSGAGDRRPRRASEPWVSLRGAGAARGRRGAACGGRGRWGVGPSGSASGLAGTVCGTPRRTKKKYGHEKNSKFAVSFIVEN